MYWNAEAVGQGRDGNGVCRSHLTAAAAPANTVLVGKGAANTLQPGRG